MRLSTQMIADKILVQIPHHHAPDHLPQTWVDPKCLGHNLITNEISHVSLI